MYTANFNSQILLNGAGSVLQVRLKECYKKSIDDNHNCRLTRTANPLSANKIYMEISDTIDHLYHKPNPSTEDNEACEKYQNFSEIISKLSGNINFSYLTCDNNPNANSQAFITLFSKIADEEIGFSLDSKSYTNLVQGIENLNTKTRIQAASIIPQHLSSPITLSFNMCINNLTDEGHACSNIPTSIFTTKEKINRYLDSLIIKAIIDNPEQFNREEVIIKENDLNTFKNSSIDSSEKHELAKDILHAITFNDNLPKISSQIVEILQNTFNLKYDKPSAEKLKKCIESIGDNTNYTNFVCSNNNPEENFINLIKLLEFKHLQMDLNKKTIKPKTMYNSSKDENAARQQGIDIEETRNIVNGIIRSIKQQMGKKYSSKHGGYVQRILKGNHKK